MATEQSDSQVRLALGTARLGAFWQGKGLAEGVRTVAEALEQGVSVIDTADVYSRGLSERLVGTALRGRRDQALVVTKVGQVKTPGAALRSARAQGRRVGWRDVARQGRTPLDHDDVARSWASGYLRDAVRRSLRRLGTDHVDVLLLHGPDPAAVAEAAWRPAVEELRGTGEVRAFGISGDTPEAARAALEVEGLEYLQLTLNVLSSPAEWELVERAAARGVRVMARAPFAGGRAPGVLSDGVLDEEVAAACLHHVLGAPALWAVVAGASTAAHVRDLAQLAARPPERQRSAELVARVRERSGADRAA